LNKHSLWKLITAFVILALLGATALVVVMPKLQSIQYSNSVTDATAKRTAHQLRQIARLNDLDTKHAQLEARLAALKLQVPQDSATSALLNQLQQAAGSRGISIDSIAVGEPKAFIPGINLTGADVAPAIANLGTGKLFSQVITVAASGSFRGLASLLSGVRNMNRSTVVYSVALNRTQQTNATVEASINIAFEVFYLKQ
jgi:Tfp pilus assembly protein PilO